MPIIEICPVCGCVGFPVNEQTVKSLANKSFDSRKSNKTCACVDKACEVAYFCENETIKLCEIRVRLWYKDEKIDVPVCYCSILTRADILDAVGHGCHTIDEVQEYTGKNITGKCQSENPLGLCCRNVFLWEIAKAKEGLEKD